MITLPTGRAPRPRPYQLDNIDQVHAAFAAGAQTVLTVMPTGSGKTVTFAEIAKRAAESKTDTVILVHRDSLLLQASQKLSDCGVAHGIIAPGHRRTSDRVQVASVHTLARRLELYNFKLIIIDEAHHATAPTYLKVLAAYPLAHVLGVTATPMRPDGAGLDAVFERLVLGPSIRQLIDDGYLVEPVVYGPPRRVDLSAVHTRAGDYDQRQLAAAMDTSQITGDAVEHYRQLCPGRPAVAFCVSIQHAEDVARDFCAAGYRFEVVHGKMHVDQIRYAIAGLGNGRLDGLASCDLISEGTDVPAIEVIIGLRPTKSLVINLQQVGRGLRPVYAPGMPLETPAQRLAAIAAGPKPRAIILDHAGNVFKHGCPDEDREWSLEGRPKRARGAGELPEVAVKQCTRCLGTHKPAPRCPHCGFEYPIEAAVPDQRAGTLEPIDAAALKRAREREVADCSTYDDFKAVGRRRGYAPQWAWRKFQEKRGKPRDPDHAAHPTGNWSAT
jgi:DNA repair protein RadD